jgi:hypothetical protein
VEAADGIALVLVIEERKCCRKSAAVASVVAKSRRVRELALVLIAMTNVVYIYQTKRTTKFCASSLGNYYCDATILALRTRTVSRKSAWTRESLVSSG